MAANSISDLHGHSTTDVEGGKHASSGNVGLNSGQNDGLNHGFDVEVNSNLNHNGDNNCDSTSQAAESVMGMEHNEAADASLKEPNKGARVPQPTNKGNRVPYANLFKDNRRVNESQKLQHFPKGTNRLEFTYDDIDTVEETYGICLLGFVISGRPPTSALLDLVRRWGKDVKFQTHASGWIVFTFPSIDVKERVLGGGTYLVYGYHLYLKEMPRCFCFEEEDINTLPSWIQIHGLPPDCWNHFILGNITSEIGVPLHMDLLTHERKKSVFARVLIEINAANPRVQEIEIGLPKRRVKLNIVYEENIKFCSDCNRAGHDSTSCPKLNTPAGAGNSSHVPHHVPRHRSKSVTWQRDRSRGRSRVSANHRNAPSRPPTKGTNTDIVKDVPKLQDATKEVPMVENQIHTHGNNALGLEQVMIDKGKKVLEGDTPQPGAPSSSGKVDEEGYTLVSNKKKNKNKKKKKKQGKGGVDDRDEQLSTFFEDMCVPDSCDTEYRPNGSYNMENRFFGNKEKGRQPKIVSGPQ